MITNAYLNALRSAAFTACSHPAFLRSRAQDGATPLYIAALKEHVTCVKLLLEAGADTSVKIDVRIGYHYVMLPVAFQHASPRNPPPSQDGRTPLHIASQYGHAACLKLLLAAGADKDAKTDVRIVNLCLSHLFGLPAGFRACSQHASLHSQDGYTPLYIATFNGHEACEKLLLAAGADTDAKENVRIGNLCVSHCLCCQQLSNVPSNHPAILRPRRMDGRRCTLLWKRGTWRA